MKGNSSHYHFIGIGGIGMSGLAKILLQKGYKVSGSDPKNNRQIEELKKLGASICHEQKGLLIQPHQTIVYSTDIKENNAEWLKASDLKLQVIHRADLLSEIMKEFICFLVAGSHGKTTTSSMLAWTLKVCHNEPSFAVGGVIHDLQTNANYLPSPYFVAEADESDGSFLKLPASGAIVTSSDDDHLNYWKSSQELKNAYVEFMQKIDDPKKLFVSGEDLFLKGFSYLATTYGFGYENALRIDAFRQLQRSTECLFHYKNFTSRLLNLKLKGRHNVLNAAAVFGLCFELGCDPELICQGIETFRGTERRLEEKGSRDDVDFYDDYAHHPTEVQATLSAVKGSNPGRRIVAIFQPHRFTRLKDQMEAFPLCFNHADICIVTDVYSAGEEPIGGITSEILFERLKLHHPNVFYFKKGELIHSCIKLIKPLDVVITLGAGDITECSPSIIKQMV